MKNYFKGQKTKLGRLLRKFYSVRKLRNCKWIQDTTIREFNVELMPYGEDDGDFWDFQNINFVDKKGNKSWDCFNKQIDDIIKKHSGLVNPIGRIDFKYPCSEYDWNQFTIWNKNK